MTNDRATCANTRRRGIQIFFALLVVISISDCKKEKDRPTSNPFAGKLRTLTDNLTGADSLYFFYDSTNGRLIKALLNRELSGSIRYTVLIQHDAGSLINMSFYENSNPGFRIIFRIRTSGKQITSISKLDTASGTETVSTSVVINDKRVDSVIDIGAYPSIFFTDFHDADFTYANGNCVYYTSNWLQFSSPVSPLYVNVYDTLSFYYTNLPNTNMLRYQLPTDIVTNPGYSYLFLLFLLQLDGYYILPLNSNLIDNIINTRFVTKYSYEFNTNNTISVVRINTKLNAGARESNYEQHMTYY